MILVKKIENFQEYVINNLGEVRKDKKIINPSILGSGYYYIRLRKNLKRVSRLVAESFIPNPLNKPQVNHIDGNKLNNNASNLEWVTRSENMKHAYNNGLCKAGGENSRNHKLNWDKVNFIRKSKLKNIELANKFNVSQSIISEIKHNKYWVKTEDRLLI